MSTKKIATYEQVILSALSQREIDGLAFAKAVFGLEIGRASCRERV